MNGMNHHRRPNIRERFRYIGGVVLQGSELHNNGYGENIRIDSVFSKN